jgi:hypothetical protein
LVYLSAPCLLKIISQRLAAAFELDNAPGEAGVAAVLAEQPILPPGFSRKITSDGDTVEIALASEVDGLLDSAHLGVPGVLARGEQGGWTAMAQAVDPRARPVDFTVQDERVAARAGWCFTLLLNSNSLIARLEKVKK